MAKVKITVDEIIATLQRSSDPTLLAEGVDDIAMLRRLEDKYEDEGLSILPVGGRSAVLEVFDRRNEIGNSKTVLFLADQDSWIYSGIPAGYVNDNLLFTDGYSIENDLYRDGCLERLLTNAEKDRFARDLKKFIDWYAISLARHLNDKSVPLSVHPAAVLDDPVRFNADIQLRQGEAAPEAHVAELSENYMKVLRGKSLMAILVRQLSASSRPIKHSVKSLMEHGSVSGGDLFLRITTWLEPHIRSGN